MAPSGDFYHVYLFYSVVTCAKFCSNDLVFFTAVLGVIIRGSESNLISSPIKLNTTLYLLLHCSCPFISFNNSFVLPTLIRLFCISLRKCTQTVQLAITLTWYVSTWFTSAFSFMLLLSRAFISMYTIVFHSELYSVYVPLSSKYTHGNL